MGLPLGTYLVAFGTVFQNNFEKLLPALQNFTANAMEFRVSPQKVSISAFQHIKRNAQLSSSSTLPVDRFGCTRDESLAAMRS